MRGSKGILSGLTESTDHPIACVPTTSEDKNEYEAVQVGHE